MTDSKDLLSMLSPPDSEDPDWIAISEAVRFGVSIMLERSLWIRTYSAIDELPDSILDAMAIAMRTQYYKETLDIGTKRKLVKNALKWRIHAGTPGTVKELIQTIFGEGELEEWFNNGGDPYTFDVVLPASLSPETEEIDQLAQILKNAKNARSHNNGLTFEEKDNLKLIKEDAKAYSYVVPYCGTMPYVAQLAGVDRVALQLQRKQTTAAKTGLEPSKDLKAGTRPYTAQIGKNDAVGAALGKNGTAGSVVPRNASESMYAGTNPYEAQIGKADRVAASLQKSTTAAGVKVVDTSESVKAGTVPYTATAGSAENAAVTASKASVQPWYKTAKPGADTVPKK